MGGRYPHSKKGIVKHEPMELPFEVNQQMLWRLEELAKYYGFRLVPMPYERPDRQFEVSVQPMPMYAVVDVDHRSESEFEFGGSRA